MRHDELLEELGRGAFGAVWRALQAGRGGQNAWGVTP
jgi:hypothetical protein